MKYQKMASFWLVLTYLSYLFYNPIDFVFIGFVFCVSLFAFEIYLNYLNLIREQDIKMKNSEDKELLELKLLHEKENLRASIEVSRNQRVLQGQMTNSKKPSKEEFRW